jgi:hypothetical protein
VVNGWSPDQDHDQDHDEHNDEHGQQVHGAGMPLGRPTQPGGNVAKHTATIEVSVTVDPLIYPNDADEVLRVTIGELGQEITERVAAGRPQGVVIEVKDGRVRRPIEPDVAAHLAAAGETPPVKAPAKKAPAKKK